MSTCASLEATLEQFHAYVAAHAAGPDDDAMKNMMAAQLMSIMATIDGLTDIDLIKATSLTNVITAGPWNHGQKLRLSARLTARYSVVILQQTSKPQQQCMTYEDYLTAPDWAEVDGATGMQVKIRVVASRAVTLDLINPNEKTLARMSAIAARPYACHGEISASQLKSIKEKIK